MPRPNLDWALPWKEKRILREQKGKAGLFFAAPGEIFGERGDEEDRGFTPWNGYG